MLVLDSVAKLFNTGLVSLRSGTNGVYRYESNGTVALIAIVSYFNAFPCPKAADDQITGVYEVMSRPRISFT